jgi:hypothetical protein
MKIKDRSTTMSKRRVQHRHDQFGRASAPTILQRVHTIRGPNINHASSVLRPQSLAGGPMFQAVDRAQALDQVVKRGLRDLKLEKLTFRRVETKQDELCAFMLDDPGINPMLVALPDGRHRSPHSDRTVHVVKRVGPPLRLPRKPAASTAKSNNRGYAGRGISFLGHTTPRLPNADHPEQIAGLEERQAFGLKDRVQFHVPSRVTVAGL